MLTPVNHSKCKIVESHDSESDLDIQLNISAPKHLKEVYEKARKDRKYT